MTFPLHPRLVADCHALGQFALCTALVMDDARFPWVILVPQRPDIREIFELREDEQAQVWRESSLLARAMMRACRGDKFNLAALGNVVPQLHIHHIVRRIGDAAWPAPVWGRGEAVPYEAEALRGLFERLLGELPGDFRAAAAEIVAARVPQT
jgi:diadenosine tetraphosphate (Ap4A) HIT family hydrolase